MENTNKIIEKIKNLFDLSRNNPNENEAMAAALKAQELMAKYNVSMVQVDDAEDSTSEEITTTCVNVNEIKGSNGTIKWRFELARAVGSNFRCEICFSNVGDVYFVGYKTDSEIAANTFKFLFETGNRLSVRYYQKARSLGMNTDGIRYAYLIGFVRGIKDRLERQSFELQIVTSREVKDKFNEMTQGYKKKDVKTSVKCNRNCAYAFDTGRDDGRNVVDGTRLEDRQTHIEDRVG